MAIETLSRDNNSMQSHTHTRRPSVLYGLMRSPSSAAFVVVGGAAASILDPPSTQRTMTMFTQGK